MIYLIYSKLIVERNEDCVVWNPDGKGQFSVRSCYACLRHAPTSTIPCKGVWVGKVPHKVAFFVSTATEFPY